MRVSFQIIDGLANDFTGQAIERAKHLAQIVIEEQKRVVCADLRRLEHLRLNRLLRIAGKFSDLALHFTQKALQTSLLIEPANLDRLTGPLRVANLLGKHL